MPALARAPGVARVVASGTANGQQCVNVFHVLKGIYPGTAWTAGEIQNLANFMAAQFTTAFLPSMTSGYSGDQIEAIDLTSDDGLSAQAVIAGSGGGGSGTNMPQSASAAVSWKILRHYRGGHPRTYVGPLGNSAVESAVSLAAAFVSGLKTRAIAFNSNISNDSTVGPSIRLGCLHRQVNKDKPSVPLWSSIVGADVDSRIDSQRRRLGPDR